MTQQQKRQGLLNSIAGAAALAKDAGKTTVANSINKAIKKAQK